jgi:hypothetical protein
MGNFDGIFVRNHLRTFYGAPGEMLVGGSGADTFAFEPFWSKHHLKLSREQRCHPDQPAPRMNYANMMSSRAITQSGANTVINDHAGDTVTLLGVAASSLTANNFSLKA